MVEQSVAEVAEVGRGLVVGSNAPAVSLRGFNTDQWRIGRERIEPGTSWVISKNQDRDM